MRHYPRAEYDEEIVRRAIHFTAVYDLDKGRYVQLEFATLREAIAYVRFAADSNEWMVYAVAAHNQDAHLARPLWQRFLELRGED